MKLKIITFGLILFGAVQTNSYAVVYKCEIGGVTSYSQEPCDANDKSKGVYKPSTQSMAYTSKITPVVKVEDEDTPVNTMDAGNAIIINNGSCNRDSYSGVIENISNYSTYRATIKVAFNYYKDMMAKKEWDNQRKTFTLKPGKKISFYIKGRPAPSSYSIECKVTRSIKFIDSTVTR